MRIPPLVLCCFFSVVTGAGALSAVLFGSQCECKPTWHHDGTMWVIKCVGKCGQNSALKCQRIDIGGGTYRCVCDGVDDFPECECRGDFWLVPGANWEAECLNGCSGGKQCIEEVAPTDQGQPVCECQ